MKFDHIVTVADFENLPEDQKQECFDQKWKEVKERRELEQTLVPRLPIRPAAPQRVEVSSSTGDPDKAAREFFQRFPETREIRIGNTVYERGRR